MMTNVHVIELSFLFINTPLVDMG